MKRLVNILSAVAVAVAVAVAALAHASLHPMASARPCAQRQISQHVPRNPVSPQKSGEPLLRAH
jgi:hypothetical protein